LLASLKCDSGKIGLLDHVWQSCFGAGVRWVSCCVWMRKFYDTSQRQCEKDNIQQDWLRWV
jgi:hypothetical protein